MKPKTIISICLSLLSLSSFAQKDLSNFTGTLSFKESNYYFSISRSLYDTATSFYEFTTFADLDNLITIRESSSLSTQDLSQEYLSFKLVKIHDSLIIKYLYPNNKYHSVYQYPINKRDTLEVCRSGYKMILDSNSINIDINDCPYYKFQTTYQGDTIIKYKDYVMDCYIIEQYCQYHHLTSKHIIRIYIDKKLLSPVYEKEYSFFQHSLISTEIPRNQWLLTREMKLIDIDDDRH